MALLKSWRDLKRLAAKLGPAGVQGLLTQEQPVMPSLSQSPSLALSPSQLLSLGQGLKLDHISDVAPSPGRMVVASGKPLRHMDWGGKHFVLETRGIRLDAWKANPQMWWLHDSHIPLGTSDLVLEPDGRLIAENIRFHRRKLSLSGWTAGEFDTGVIADLYDAGVIRASSVQVMFTAEDIARVFETEEHIILPSSELIEWSLVTAPADREAVRLSLSGLGVNDQLATLLLGEAARENSGPVAITSPAETETTMNELELTEDDIKALALEIAAALTTDDDFLASIAAAVATATPVQEAIANGVALALPQAHVMQAATPEVVTPAPAENKVTRLVFNRTVQATTTPAQPAAAKPTVHINRANQPTPRTVALANMARVRK